MENIEKLMSAGDFASAAKRLKARLLVSPGDEKAKLLLGTCLHLLGDEESFAEIDDELSRSPTARKLAAWPVYHALRVAACGGVLLLSGVFCDLQGAVSRPLYGGPPIDVRKMSVPVPNASDGKYSAYVRLSWKAVKGAVRYKVRRATSSDYAKSKTIATVTGTTYKDKVPAKHPRKKYYYWIVPYEMYGRGKKDVAKVDSGYAKQVLSLNTPGVMTVGSVWQFRVSGNKGQKIKASACKWSIVSGDGYASLTRSGKLMARKEGVVVVEASYNGAKARKTLEIVDMLYTLYGGPQMPVVTKYGGPPIMALEKVSTDSMEMVVLPLETVE